MGTIVHYFQDIPQEQWDEASLKQAYERMADDLSTKWELNYDQNVDPAKASRTSLQQFLRWALTGGRPGPALILTMSLLGRDVSLSRIEDAAASLRGNST